MVRFKNFDWLATVFYPLSVILMEAFWVAPWLSFIGVWPLFDVKRSILSLASVIIVLGLALAATRIFTQQKMALWKIQLIIIGGGLLVMLIVLAVEYNDGYTFLSGAWFAHLGRLLGDIFDNTGTIIVAIPAFIYLWWRGIMLGQSTTYFKSIYRSFLVGMAALVVLIIFWQIFSNSGSIPGPGGVLGIDVIAFFFFGLLAITITHLYTMRQSMPKEDAKLTSVWRWLPVMLGVIGGLIAVGFGMASAISPDFIDTVGIGASATVDFLSKIFEYVAIPFLYLTNWLVTALLWFIRLISGGDNNPPPTSANMTQPNVEVGAGGEFPAVVTAIIKWSVLAIIIAVVIFILLKAVSRYRDRQARENIDETRDSLFSWRALRDDLRQLFGAMGKRFQRKPPAPAPYRFDEDAARRLDIREIYRHLQWEAGKSGIPRRLHETAIEYARRIEYITPDSSQPLRDITGLYENVRYGEANIPEAKVDSANKVWQTLKTLLRRLRGA